MLTNSKKLLSGVLAAGMMVSAATSFGATTIGSGSVVGSGALTTDVVWDDNFPGMATGAVDGIAIQAKILPVLNMVIDGDGVINLGTLSSDIYSSGSVDVELGTNAVNGATITVRSTKGGLQNAANPGVYVNSSTDDEIADSYKFSGILGNSDSSYTSFSQTSPIASGVEVADNTTSHILYTSNKPQKIEGIDDVTFVVAAKPGLETPAGSYSDVVVVTVSGNF